MTGILLVDDDALICATWRRGLERYELGPVETNTSGLAGLALLRSRDYDLCLLDQCMPDATGLEVLQAAAEAHVGTPIILVSGYANREEAVQALHLGAADVWFKPLGLRELADGVSSFLHERQPPTHVVAERMDRWLADHAATQGLHLANLSQAMGISPSYAAKLLREHLGQTFPQRLRHHRVERAKELLREPQALIKVVAAQCGFRDRRRLDEAFRAVVGVTPARFRQSSAGIRSE